LILLAILNDSFRCCSIRDNWQRRCSEAGLPLSGAVMSEFKKRISQAGSSHSKAKLNLTSMELNDRQVRRHLKLDLVGASLSYRVISSRS